MDKLNKVEKKEFDNVTGGYNVSEKRTLRCNGCGDIKTVTFEEARSIFLGPNGPVHCPAGPTRRRAGKWVDITGKESLYK